MKVTQYYSQRKIQKNPFLLVGGILDLHYPNSISTITGMIMGKYGDGNYRQGLVLSSISQGFRLLSNIKSYPKIFIQFNLLFGSIFKNRLDWVLNQVLHVWNHVIDKISFLLLAIKSKHSKDNLLSSSNFHNPHCVF